MNSSAPPAGGPVFTGLGVLSAFGAGLAPLAEATAAGTGTGFAEVTRFDTARRGTRRAALLAGPPPPLADAVLGAVADACTQAELTDGAPLLLALHSDQHTRGTAAKVAAGAAALGLAGVARVYTGACVAAATAVADAAALVGSGRHPRVVVAAGHLVEPGVFAAFDAGRALARDGVLRPFSAGRGGTLLGDAAAAVVVEAADAAAGRGARPLARLAGWGRSGDAYHVCRPRPDGSGVARAVRSALARAGVAPAEVGYVNANGTGSPMSDLAEARALREVFGDALAELPVSSSKSVHGHALEASALLELAVTIGALGSGRLPVNAGWLGPDPEVELNLVLPGPRPGARPRYALSLNSAFGGANTALLVGAA
ncbi:MULTISPECIES: beta-ketoacyl synthase N-terminal-like domain-containing protein [Kitasatospora]|uniref:Putative 3-oxoacyl-[acyl-carrier-protein] synthase n=1 Tax=Kitasatospora setae (strain ATCC 33774 / DSM 43861 / JCM 3304 / KCC A-0304 / NBRC 14216 / KM-6054) TaxID=452652 RepID=E4N2W2_KITSK|nr:MULTISPECIES: beta-ketoacyl synthase N-terminal-like domain-containing protein [Kitasatospora]BAJ32496.1 putative 3-oxoacyl-[acyl-carrier-protein] synthase [Kitasatospora setae KM-6054]